MVRGFFCLFVCLFVSVSLPLNELLQLKIRHILSSPQKNTCISVMLLRKSTAVSIFENLSSTPTYV